MSNDPSIVTQPVLSNAFGDVEGLNALEMAQARSAQARAVFEHQEGVDVWMDDYWKLVGVGWSWRQAVYILWSAQPADLRQPKTQGELATQILGLQNDRTIRAWRQKNPHIDATIADMAYSVLAKNRAEVLAALAAMASVRDYKAHADRRLFLEMTGDYVPRSIQANMSPNTAAREEVASAGDADLEKWAQAPVVDVEFSDVSE